jgi:hypothetical protein
VLSAPRVRIESASDLSFLAGRLAGSIAYRSPTRADTPSEAAELWAKSKSGCG